MISQSWYFDEDYPHFGYWHILENNPNLKTVSYMGTVEDLTDTESHMDTEICDGLDNNCNGLADEGLGTITLVAVIVWADGGITTVDVSSPQQVRKRPLVRFAHTLCD